MQVSSQLPDNPAGRGGWRLGTLWNSGGEPLQWIIIDLGTPQSVQAVRLTVSQYPEGETVHRVLIRGASGDFQLLHTFSGDTRDGDALEYRPPQPAAGIQFVRVETPIRRVSWREIEHYPGGIMAAPSRWSQDMGAWHLLAAVDKRTAGSACPARICRTSCT
jgi:hypothetical protein